MLILLFWFGDLCCQIRLLFADSRLCNYFEGSTRRRLLGACDASVASLDRSVVLGRRTFNRTVERAPRSVLRSNPIPSTRAGAPEGPRLASPERPRHHSPPFLPARNRAARGAGGGSSRTRRAAWAGPLRIPAWSLSALDCACGREPRSLAYARSDEGLPDSADPVSVAK